MILPPIMIKLIAILSLITMAGASCPDGCDGSCCELEPNKFECCPYVNGVCCTTGKHCCPQGSTCDSQAMTCSYPSGPSWPYRALFAPHVTEKKKDEGAIDNSKSPYNICPDRKFVCAIGSTCCPMEGGKWGCCHHINGICCSDGGHCCPLGSKCNAVDGTCIESVSPLVSMLAGGRPRVQSARRKPNAGGVQQQPGDLIAYPEHACDASRKYTCAMNTTCCRAKPDGWACCPLPDAVCCSDGVNCCPKGYKCNIAGGTCIRDGANPMAPIVAQSVKQPASIVDEQAVSSVCPGGLISCSSGTCCPTTHGNYRCCQYKEGVCCSNSDSCCPANTKCDPYSGNCLPSQETLFDQLMTSTGQAVKPFHVGRKTNPQPSTTVTTTDKTAKVTVCPGQDFYCPATSKCCPGNEGNWLCCPFENAICCSDRSHCCPQNTVCSDTHQGCLPISSDDQFLKPPPSSPPTAAVAVGSKDQLCPDKMSMCNNDETCCQLADGDWGCCPLLNAVCCADSDTCCPANTRCTEEGNCEATDGTPLTYTAPYLLPKKQGGKRVKAFVHDVPPAVFKFLHAKTASPASRDLMLLSPSYRQLKQLHHAICPSGVHKCLQDEKCCPSDVHGYTCIPTASTCCTSALDTFCPPGKLCASSGRTCNRG